MKKPAFFLIAVLIISLLCSGPAGAADGELAPEAIPIPGVYTLYSIEYGGKQTKPSDFSLSAVLTLKEDGTGALALNGSENPLPKWEEADGTITLYNANGDALACAVQDGIITIEMGQDYYWYLAHEGTGIADADAARRYESMLYALCESIDGSAGAHLSYECHTDYMDSTSVFDVHARDGIFYSGRITKAGGYERQSATFFKDGAVYMLYPKELKGSIATETSSSIITGNPLLLDDLYQLVYTMAQRGDYTVEKRELEGESFTVEVFPATAYKPEAAFYFTEEGDLAYILEGASPLTPDMGETAYTIRAIDTETDDTLFDISGYKIA